jgi:hypothetical protein
METTSHGRQGQQNNLGDWRLNMKFSKMAYLSRSAGRLHSAQTNNIN